MHHRKKQPPRTTTTRGDLPCPPCPSPMHPVLLLLLPRTTAPPPLLETVHRFTPPRLFLLLQWWQRFYLLQPQQQRMLLHRWLPVRLVHTQPTTTTTTPSNAPPATTTRTTPSVDFIVRRDLWSIPFWAFGNNRHRPPCPCPIVVVVVTRRTRTTLLLEPNHEGIHKLPPKRRPSCYSSRQPILLRIPVPTMPVRPIQSHHYPITTLQTATITTRRTIPSGGDHQRRIMILWIIATLTMTTTTIILIRIWTKTNCPLSWPMRNRIKRRVNERIVHGNQFNKRFDPVICCCNDGIQD